MTVHQICSEHSGLEEQVRAMKEILDKRKNISLQWIVAMIFIALGWAYTVGITMQRITVVEQKVMEFDTGEKERTAALIAVQKDVSYLREGMDELKRDVKRKIAN